MTRFLVFLLICSGLQLSAQQLPYYLPTGVSYNKSVPTPQSVIGHEVGEWHITHDRLVYYMRAVAASSNRMKLTVTGTTHEGRQQLAIFISSPENLARIETIREQHLQLCDPAKSGSLNPESMPAVVWIGCSIHGNEPSGANMSLLLAYYLAAAEGSKVDELLKNTVIILDPSFNPDGLNRFATWVNMHKSAVVVSDPNNRELNEVWPGGRTNHYWFDLNRDWLPAQQPESRNRIQVYHDWRPNILTDHHEMGSNSTFFFQPGVPSRVNPNTPDLNQELTAAIGNFHARYLDSIGSLYFTKEGYDDFYYGKGSTFPDIHGGVGILFEQGSSRGHFQQTQNGLLTFPFTIRNQFVTALSTLEAAVQLRVRLLNYQRDFYQQVKKEAAAFPVKAYVFGHPYDQSRNRIFIDMLLRHRVEVYENKNTLSAEGKTFQPGTSWIIPVQQPQFKVIKTLFEKTFSYKDSLFYDITSWTFPLALGLPYAELKTLPATPMGPALVQVPVFTAASPLSTTAYAYAFDWDDLHAPRLLYALQSKGVTVRVATQLFEASTPSGNRSFTYGTIVIPVGLQRMSKEALVQLLDKEARQAGITIHTLTTGLSAKGIDLGSNSFLPVKSPRILLVGGTGVSSTDAGEIWHLLDQRLQIPVTIVETERLSSVNLGSYTTVILPEGNYTSVSKPVQERLQQYVSNGGTILAFENAGRFLSGAGITKTLYKTAEGKPDTSLVLPYYLRTDETRAREMPGSIFEAVIDNTHPLCYGYREKNISIFKANTLFMDKNNDPYSTPVLLTSNPLQSGYLHRTYNEAVKQMAVVNVESVGRGRVITYNENMAFRAFWLGTMKLLVNGIFFQ